MRSGTKVYISNPKLKSYGQTGTITYDYLNTYEVRLDNGDVREYRKDNVRPLEENKVTKEQNDLHVMIFHELDGECDYDFSGDKLPSIKTLEEDYDLSSGMVMIGTMEEIQDSINDSLNSWDYVIGIIDNKPFKASRQIKYEGAIDA